MMQRSWKHNKSRKIIVVLLSLSLLCVLFGNRQAFVFASGIGEGGEQEESDSGSAYSPQISVNEIYVPLVFNPPSFQPAGGTPRVNAPYFPGEINFVETAIFWFGKITYDENYTDVRVGYSDSELFVHVAVLDRLLWYDKTPVKDDLTSWDSASLYLDLDGNAGEAPDTNTFLFVGQLNWFEDRAGFQTAYKGNGSGWINSPIPFSTETGHRGNPNDANRDNGWRLTYRIPFSSLGLSGPPLQGKVWGLGVALHDRDSEQGPPRADKVWPEGMEQGRPASWGELRFGLPAFVTPNPAQAGSTMIRDDLNGMVSQDGMVGGGTNCGEGLDFYTEWGDANYAGASQVNVQNQYDVADFPCFSKYYLALPLSAVPANKVILSATLTLYQFGNAGGGEWGEPPSSYIQVMTVGGGWDEDTITWNNAPGMLENISGAWVDPVPAGTKWPGVPRVWDVSRAVAEAYTSGASLNLVLYSADNARHTGKYFVSADTDQYGLDWRPTLEVIWGDP